MNKVYKLTLPEAKEMLLAGLTNTYDDDFDGAEVRFNVQRGSNDPREPPCDMVTDVEVEIKNCR